MQPLKVSRSTRQQIHDQCFKAALQTPEMVRQLLDAYLPKDVQAMLDLGSLQQENDLLLDEGLHIHQTDALFRVKCRHIGEDAFILIEHKKSIDHKCIDQVFRYVSLVRDREYKRRGSKGKRSPVYVMVLYHGKRRIRRSLKWQSLANENLIMRHMVTEGPQLIDVRRAPSALLKRRPLLRLWFIILKYVERFDFFYVLRHMWPLINKVVPRYMNFVWQMLEYVSSVTPDTAAVRVEIEIMLKQVKTESKGDRKMMTLAEGWLNEGYQKGIEQGLEQGLEQAEQRKEAAILEIAKKMLVAGDACNKVAKICGLPLKQVSKLRDDSVL